MVGTWTAKTAQMTMEGKKRKAEINLSCAPTSGGFAVSCTTKVTGVLCVYAPGRVD